MLQILASLSPSHLHLPTASAATVLPASTKTYITPGIQTKERKKKSSKFAVLRPPFHPTHPLPVIPKCRVVNF